MIEMLVTKMHLKLHTNYQYNFGRIKMYKIRNIKTLKNEYQELYLSKKKTKLSKQNNTKKSKYLFTILYN